MSATWVFDLVDAIGRSVTGGGLYNATDITLTFQSLAQPSSLQMRLPVDSQDAALILNNPNTRYFVKAYRTRSGGVVGDRVLRFYGSVEVDEISGRDVVITAVDPMVVLAARFTSAVYASQDVGTTIKAIVDATNTTDGETGVQTSSAYITASISQPFDASQNTPSIASVVQEIAQQQDGPDAWIVPQEYAAGKIGKLYVSASRGAASSAVFGYGNGTNGNCRSMGRVIDRTKVANDIRGTGENVAASAQTDATSINALGRRVEYVQFVGEKSATVVASKARGRLNRRSKPATIAEYTVEPDYGAPVIFDDYNIGDTVTLDYRNGAVSWTAKPRVVSATVTVNNAGHEQPAQIAFDSRADVA